MTRPERAAIVGLFINIVLAACKLAVGIIGHSFALVADAAESVVDIAGSLIVWRALEYGRKPADEKHPFGHGKAESLAALTVGLLVVIAGIGIAVESIHGLLEPRQSPAWYTLFVLAIVIVVKESMFRFVRHAATQSRSSAGIADAWHHRSDAITSIAAFIGISIAIFAGQRFAAADSWAALVASMVIVVNGLYLIRTPLGELMDESEPTVAAQCRELLLQVNGILAIELCEARKVGRQYRVIAHVEVNPDMTVAEAHALTGKAKAVVRSRLPQVSSLLIHIEPYRHGASSDSDLKGNPMNQNPKTHEDVRNVVRIGYAEIAARGSTRRGGGCCGPATSCCGENRVAKLVGYSENELANLPEGADMGLSCGNPTAIASLKPGEVVLDLGSGGGFDCFIAGPKVGTTGRVIGVDMTAEMLSKARGDVTAYRERTGLENVEFRLSEIEHLPAADNSIDVVISNCVINLSPDKPQVWREIARVLRPGGRVAVSDLALLRPLPEAVRSDIEALIGCIAGAELVENTERFAREAGLVDIQIERKPQYIESMTSFQDPLYRRIMASLPQGAGPADFITSMNVSARKPA